MMLHPPPSQRRSVFKLLAFSLVALVLMLGLVAWGLVQAARQAPSFYTAAIAQDPAQQKAAGQRFEQQALAVHNHLRAAGRKSARFTAEEINGWLAAELPVKLPHALPPGFAEPRVEIRPGSLQLAVQAREHGLSTVLLLSGEVFLSTEPNEIAVRLKRARLGALPLPLSQIQEALAEQPARLGLRLRWSELEGDPVLLIKLLPPAAADEPTATLESIELGDGEVTIAWQTPERGTRAEAEVAEAPSAAAAGGGHER